MSSCAIETLSEEHRAGVLSMIASAFASDDPLARSQGIGEADFRDLIDGLYDSLLACGLSFVAHDRENGQIAAVVLADDLGGDGDEGSDAIAELIQAARRDYFSRQSPGSGRLAHIHFIASSPAYRRQRLVQAVVGACLEEARRQAFDRVFVEASGNRSRALLAAHFGFVERVRVGYADFSWQGRHPFSSIADHGGLSLMDLDLRAAVKNSD